MSPQPPASDGSLPSSDPGLRNPPTLLAGAAGRRRRHMPVPSASLHPTSDPSVEAGSGRVIGPVTRPPPSEEGRSSAELV